MTTTTRGGTLVKDQELHRRRSDIPDTDQLPLFQGASIWDRAHRTATWLDIAKGLPSNLGVEFTREHGWRIVIIPLTVRRNLERLDAIEDPLPAEERREHALRRGQADDMLAQALSVLRSVQVEQDIAHLRREDGAA